MSHLTKISRWAALSALVLVMPALLPAAIVYTAVLNGSNEVPPNASTATGFVTLTLNGDSLTVNETFIGLAMNASAAHIHCCGPVGLNEPVAVPFPGFPPSNSGSYMQTFDLTLVSTYDATFVTAEGGTAALAEAALIAALNGGQTYANIHDSLFPGGEIRGQILQAVPEPATAGFCLLGLTCIVTRFLRPGARRPSE